MGLRFVGRYYSLFLQSTTLPTCTTSLHPRDKEALTPLSFQQAMSKAETFEDFSVEEKEKSFSECSSGCQSGWTLYLGQTQDSPILSPGSHGSAHEEEEEDLSMLSDASSGPPHAKEDDCINLCYCYNDETGSFKRRRFEEEQEQQKKRRQQEHCSSFLEDTASSPLLCISKETSSNSSSSCSSKMLSCGFSANHFKVSSQEEGEKLALKRER